MKNFNRREGSYNDLFAKDLRFEFLAERSGTDRTYFRFISKICLSN